MSYDVINTRKDLIITRSVQVDLVLANYLYSWNNLSPYNVLPYFNFIPPRTLKTL